MAEESACGSRKSNNNCSVVGCKNTYKNCPAGTRFFSFPNEKHHANRRKAWLSALRRETIDRKPWTPTQHSRVCSLHFVDETPTRERGSPGYVPTLHLGPGPHVLQDVAEMDAVKIKEEPLEDAGQTEQELQPFSSVIIKSEVQEQFETEEEVHYKHEMQC